MTILLENPDSASSGVKILNITNNIREQRATKSERILPLIKNTAERARIINDVSILYFLFKKINN